MEYCTVWCDNKKCWLNYTKKADKKLKKKYPYGFQIKTKDFKNDTCGYEEISGEELNYKENNMYK